MRGIHLFMLLVALPAIAALGHDLYLFYINNGVANIATDVTNAIEEKGPLSMFAALGFIWTQYEPDSYKWIAENISPDFWNTLNVLLAQKAIFIGVAFAAFNYFILFILKIFRIGPFKGETSSNYSGRGRNRKHDIGKSGGKIKYNRK